MTVAFLDDVRDTDARSLARSAFRYLAMPTFLVIVLAALFFWVTGQELDSVEARTLTSDLILTRTWEHIVFTTISTVLVLALAVPLGIVATRPGREGIAGTIVGLGNAGQAIPSLGMLALLFFLFNEVSWLPGTGLVPVVVSLTAYSLLPVLRNTMIGLQRVDPSVLEAGRGMGMSNREILRQLELPLAIPVILAGVRTALVLNVGTGALAWVLGGGGLGEIIIRGYQLNRLPILMTGAVLTAALALLIDWMAGIAEDNLTPEGL